MIRFLHNVFSSSSFVPPSQFVTKHSQQVEVVTLNGTHLISKRRTWWLLVLVKEEEATARAEAQATQSPGPSLPLRRSPPVRTPSSFKGQNMLFIYLSWVRSFLFSKGFSGIPATNLKSCFLNIYQLIFSTFRVNGPANKTCPGHMCCNLG